MENENKNFYCTITGEMMVDPVIDTEGNSFERSAIESWLRAHGTSPITRTPMSMNDLRPNRALRSAIEDATNKQNQPAPLSVPPLPADIAPSQSVALPPVALTVSARELTEAELRNAGGEVPDDKKEYHMLLNLNFPEVPIGSIPSDVVLVVDVSGSMGAEAKTQSVESSNLSLLDIVKHAVTTVIRTLGPRDRLALVSFSNNAKVVLELTAMDTHGQDHAIRQLNTLQADGMTNIWDGLYRALELLKSRGNNNNEHQQENSLEATFRNSAILLLTDGEPNVEPPRGHIPMLRRYCEQNGGKYPGVISTFGFGYSLNSALLSDFAREAGGMYAFIPDSGFVGTAFVNALANILSTVATNAVVTVETNSNVSIHSSEGTLNYCPHIVSSWGTTITLGNLQLGQPRGVVLRITAPSGAPVDSLVNAKVVYRSSITFQEQESIGAAAVVAGPLVERQLLQELDANVLRVLATQCINNVSSFMTTQSIPAAQDAISQFISKLNSWLANNPDLGNRVTTTSTTTAVSHHKFVADLLADFTGQITEATSREDWYTKWGRHYFPALQRAHQLQQSNNFKDPGIQNYGGQLFHSIRDRADDVFCQLPAPKSTLHVIPGGIRYRAAPPASSASTGAPSKASAPAAPMSMSMSQFNNRDMPCFHSESSILLEDGISVMPLHSLKRGDRVAIAKTEDADNISISNNSTLAIGIIRCIVETVCDDEVADLVTLPTTGLRVTPYHPVKDEKNQWRFPIDLAASSDSTTGRLNCSSVISLLVEATDVGGSSSSLSSSTWVSSVFIDGTEAVTLSHGIQNDAVASHAYFGTDAVCQDLSKCTGWNIGKIRFPMNSMKRNEDTSEVTGFCVENELL